MIHLLPAALLSPLKATVDWARDEWKRRRRWTAADIIQFIEVSKKNNVETIQLGDIKIKFEDKK